MAGRRPGENKASTRTASLKKDPKKNVEVGSPTVSETATVSAYLGNLTLLGRVNVEDFRLGQSIGNGSNATAYRCILQKSGILVVAKLFNDSHGTTSLQKVKRTLQGENLCGGGRPGSCPNILTSFGFSFEQWQEDKSDNRKTCTSSMLFYEVMDGCLDAWAIKKKVELEEVKSEEAKRKKDLELHQKIRSIARDLLVGLRYLHQRNVFHGDVHIQNVLVVGDNAKLIDLESAYKVDVNSASMRGKNARKARKAAIFDLKAAAYVICQLLTERTRMNIYPGERDKHGKPTTDQKQMYLQLASEGVRIAKKYEEEEEAKKIFPLTKFLNTLLTIDQQLDWERVSATANALVQRFHVSRSFHGPVMFQTTVSDDGHGNAIYLDRQSVIVKDYASVLTGFKLCRAKGEDGNLNKIYFSASRFRLNLRSPHEAVITRHAVDSKSHPTNSATIMNLVGMEVKCPGNGCLKGFRVERIDNEHLRIAFISFERRTDIGKSFKVKMKFTEFNKVNLECSLVYLDRHHLVCEPGFVLKGFVLEKNHADQIRFKYWMQNIEPSS